MLDSNNGSLIYRLNENKLDFHHKKPDGSKVYRCPVCAEEGHDNKGEHLIIYPDGAFGCVVMPGETGIAHRERIYALVGISTTAVYAIKIYPKKALPRRLIYQNILGHLGQDNAHIHASEGNTSYQKSLHEGSKNSVPRVPNDDLDYLK